MEYDIDTSAAYVDLYTTCLSLSASASFSPKRSPSFSQDSRDFQLRSLLFVQFSPVFTMASTVELASSFIEGAPPGEVCQHGFPGPAAQTTIANMLYLSLQTSFLVNHPHTSQPAPTFSSPTPAPEC